MEDKKNVSFNFGENWQDFSANALDEQKFIEARNSLISLIGQDKIKDARLLDIGCGSGIFAIASAMLGTKETTGLDVSLESVTASLSNRERFKAEGYNLNFFHKSVFDEDILTLGKFDVVYSWGVLHHTGDMWRAIDISTQLVAEKGLYVIAIYKKHWSSKMWGIIKRLYNISPRIIQKSMVWVFYLIIALAKFLVTFKNPFSSRRGMNFYYNVIDWIGGYPYEYASKEEIQRVVEQNGFKLIKYIDAPTPTACHEFVFEKNG